MGKMVIWPPCLWEFWRDLGSFLIRLIVPDHPVDQAPSAV
jgi:hypothetical protein